jgi:hypothetical protein
MDFFVYEWIEHDLGDTFAIPKIHEYHPAMIPAPMDPAHQNHFLTDVICTQFPAMMRSAHITQLIRQFHLLLIVDWVD